jgi:hypothetical protein
MGGAGRRALRLVCSESNIAHCQRRGASDSTSTLRTTGPPRRSVEGEATSGRLHYLNVLQRLHATPVPPVPRDRAPHSSTHGTCAQSRRRRRSRRKG